MKWTTIPKIGFCVFLCAVLVCAGLGVRFGRNRLHAQLSDVRNADFFVQVCRDFDDSTDLIDGFSVTREEFYDFFVEDYRDFYGQKLKVTAENRLDKDITILGIQAENDDEDTYVIYLSRTPETAVTIPAGTTEPKTIWFDMVVEDLENEESLSILRSEFSMKLLYVDASTGITNLRDADPSLLQSEWIRKPNVEVVEYTTKSHENCAHCQRKTSHDIA